VKKATQETNLITQWKKGEEEETLDDKLLDILNHDEFMKPRQIYKEYQEQCSDCRTKHTVHRHLEDLEKIGKVESKGRGPSRKYRNASKPLQETRENLSSAFSEGIPPFMKNRIRVEAERAVQEEVDRIKDKVKTEIIKSTETMTNPEKQGETGKLDEHSKALLTVLPGNKEVKMSQIKELYEEEVENPLSKRSIRRRLKGLAAKDLLEMKGRASGRTYKKK